VIIRTTREIFTFAEPFKPNNIDESQPSGQYIVDGDKELIEGISRLACPRVAARPAPFGDRRIAGENPTCRDRRADFDLAFLFDRAFGDTDETI